MESEHTSLSSCPVEALNLSSLAPEVTTISWSRVQGERQTRWAGSTELEGEGTIGVMSRRNTWRGNETCSLKELQMMNTSKISLFASVTDLIEGVSVQ